MTTLTGEAPTATTTPKFCPDCGNPVRITYIIAGDTLAPGRWTCNHCPAGTTWPPSKDYRCR